MNLRSKYIDEDPEEAGAVAFHSLRHTMVTGLRAAGTRQDISKAIVGHEQDEVHANYGSFDLATLKRAIDSVNYPSIKLAALKLSI